MYMCAFAELEKLLATHLPPHIVHVQYTACPFTVHVHVNISFYTTKTLAGFTWPWKVLEF